MDGTTYTSQCMLVIFALFYEFCYIELNENFNIEVIIALCLHISTFFHIGLVPKEDAIFGHVKG